MKFLVINGPNINLLGLREPDIYGAQNYDALLELIDDTAKEAGVQIDCFQSNHEGAIVDKIQEAYGIYDGIVINDEIRQLSRTNPDPKLLRQAAVRAKCRGFLSDAARLVADGTTSYEELVRVMKG